MTGFGTRRSGRRLRGRLVVAVVAGALLAPALATPAHALRISGPSCARVIVYDVRGSGERPYALSAPGGPVAAYITSRLGPTVPFSRITNDYMAVPMPFGGWRDALKSTRFLQSVTDGANRVASDLAFIHSYCRTSRIVVTAYSQGVLAVRAGLHRTPTHNVDQVLLFGDPYFRANEPGVQTGGGFQAWQQGLARTLVGALPLFKKTIPTSVLGRVLNLCHRWDVVCQSVGGTSSHMTYGNDASYAGVFAVSALRAKGVTAPVPAPTGTGSFRYAVDSHGRGTGVNVRSGPTTSSAFVRFMPNGAQLDIACQARSESVVNGSTIWDRLTDGTWVSDWFTNTPNLNAFSPPIPQCNSAPIPATAPAGSYRYAVDSHGTGTGVNVRSAPSTGGTLVRFAENGVALDIVCQTRSDSVVNGSAIWNQLTDGNWVSDWFTNTPNVGEFSPPIPQCGTPPPVTVEPPVAAASYRYLVDSHGTGTGVNVRSSPSVSGALVRFAPNGTALDIVCQTRSDSVVNGSSIWDRLTDGTWVSDWFTNTPNVNEFSPPIPSC